MSVDLRDSAGKMTFDPCKEWRRKRTRVCANQLHMHMRDERSRVPATPDKYVITRRRVRADGQAYAERSPLAWKSKIYHYLHGIRQVPVFGAH